MTKRKIVDTIRNSKKCRRILRSCCSRNVTKFMQESSLHGLRFVADRNITIWERTFFLCSFVAAFITTANLILEIYAKWDSTPVIIGISPHPTSIMNIPFPAVTICNMNQALYSKVSKYSEDSFEHMILKVLCLSETEFDDDVQNASSFQNNNMKIEDFVQEVNFKRMFNVLRNLPNRDKLNAIPQKLVQSKSDRCGLSQMEVYTDHSQPCSKLLMHCEMGSRPFNCSMYFREIITDEGICCVFNVLHSKFLLKENVEDNSTIRDDMREAVNWNPEIGYQANLPKSYYPIPALGTGISMGLSLIVNAELDDYYCSTTNGPGFKIALHNPAETPQMKEVGLTVPIGFETRFRIEVQRAEAVSTLRDIPRKARQCIFNNEANLLYYNFYTRQSCERECQAKHIYSRCQCIPYNLPLLYRNASVCSMRETLCISRAKKLWTSDTRAPCRRSCLPNCFDISYQTVSSTVPLIKRNYTIPSELLRNTSKVYANTNMAVIHLYYGESVFHGNLKNVYIGLTEFLSNTGGIMGLFMGFSFISVAEIIYFALLRPIFEHHSARKNRRHLKNLHEPTDEVEAYKIWLGDEIHNPSRQCKINANNILASRGFNKSPFAAKMRPTKLNLTGESLNGEKRSPTLWV